MPKLTRIELTLPVPPSVNRIWRTGRGRNYLSPEAQRFKLAAKVAAAKAGYLKGDAVPFPSPMQVKVTLFWYREAKRGDLDNRAKATLDVLNGILWDDDGQVVEIHLYRREDPKAGRIVLSIEEAE